jgi:MinD-like ATPase involved in chromosome partitioning or flagellar assembly
MAAERFVVLGLAPARAAWFTTVARWSTAAALPVEFVKCLSQEEVRARLASGRPWSALLVDAATPGLDRDLVAAARSAGAVVLVVDAGTARDWRGLGAAAVLPPGFGRGELLAALEAEARPVGAADAVPAPGRGADAQPAAWRGRLVTVVGSGGTGASTVAMAVAQGLAADVRHAGVLLADLALRADQAVLHDAGDVVPGVQELVEAHRTDRLSPSAVRDLAFEAPDRGYSLLLGLRRQRDWAALRPRAVDAAIDGLRRAYGVVVADATGDVEGEAECGSVEVEERNLLARTAVREADAVVAVGRPGVTGLRHLVALVAAVVAAGASPDRVLPVVNRAPRSPRARAELARALADLGGDTPPTAGALFLPEVRRLDDLQRDAAPLPAAWARSAAAAVDAVLRRVTPAIAAGDDEPVRVAPGSLGRWAGEEAMSG